jgi:acyl-CoA synthetase (AMP-forming)/AMP-acid ligase II
MELTRGHRTIVDALLPLHACDRQGARFIPRSGEAVFFPYQDILVRAKAAAGALQARGLRPGQRVGIMLATGVEFFDAFLGAVLAGGIPAALYPPLRLGKLDEYFARTSGMLQKIDARWLITEPRIRRILGPVVEKAACIHHVLDAANLGPAAPWTPVEIDPETPAFLQFSSGTTLEPKAVMISHINLLSNLEMLDGCFQSLTPVEVERGGVCWLPLYHDMGLLGCMFLGLYHPGTVTYIGPDHFLAQPRIWLETLSRYKAAVSAAPDFAYGYCTAKIKDEELAGLDLSNWRIALNGAEPIDIDVMRRFSERMARCGFRDAAMTPAYGLAEAGLVVSFSDLDTPPRVGEFDRERLSERREVAPGRGRRVVSVGRPVAGMSVEIRDEQGRALGERRVGTIMAQGASITPGYFNDPELSARVLRNGWLDTGDLGFLLDGELYITGRAKDLIIIRGRNYAPQEIEQLVAVEGVHAVVALGAVIEGLGEQLVVLVEYEPRRSGPAPADVQADISQRILKGIALTPHDVRLLPPGTLPRTASGKMQRSEALRQYENGVLTPPDKVNLLLLAREVGRSQLAWSRRWLRQSVRPPGEAGGAEQEP